MVARERFEGEPPRTAHVITLAESSVISISYPVMRDVSRSTDVRVFYHAGNLGSRYFDVNCCVPDMHVVTLDQIGHEYARRNLHLLKAGSYSLPQKDATFSLFYGTMQATRMLAILETTEEVPKDILDLAKTLEEQKAVQRQDVITSLDSIGQAGSFTQFLLSNRYPSVVTAGLSLSSDPSVQHLVQAELVALVKEGDTSSIGQEARSLLTPWGHALLRRR